MNDHCFYYHNLIIFTILIYGKGKKPLQMFSEIMIGTSNIIHILMLFSSIICKTSTGHPWITHVWIFFHMPLARCLCLVIRVLIKSKCLISCHKHYRVEGLGVVLPFIKIIQWPICIKSLFPNFASLPPFWHNLASL